jgi:ketosteroid isomerase-like protein
VTSPATPAEVLRHYFQVEMTRDVEAIVALYAPMATFETPDQLRRGHPEIRPFYIDAAARFPVLRVEVTHAFDHGEWGLAEWSAVMVSPAGEQLSLRGANVAKVENGLLVEIRSYYDSGSYLPS